MLCLQSCFPSLVPQTLHSRPARGHPGLLVQPDKVFASLRTICSVQCLHPCTDVLGLPYKVPQAKCLRQQQFITSLFWKPEVPSQGFGRVVRERSAPGLFIWFVDGSLCIQTVCVCLPTSPLCKDTNHIGLRPALRT